MIKSLIAMTLLLLSGLVVMGQTDPSAEAWARTQMSSTVGGGTGLFATFSPRALRRGEFTAAIFYNNFKRDPGAIDVSQVPVNFTVGLGRRLELFFNADLAQRVTSRQPFLLSGYAFNLPDSLGIEREAFFGPPTAQPRGQGAAIFPGAFSPVGGILPALSGPVPGPRILSSVDRPGYYNAFPFFGRSFASANPAQDFLQQSSIGHGNVTAGLKTNLVDPDRSWFGLALINTISIPTARNLDALSKGRGTGEIDIGVYLAMSQEALGHRLRFNQHIGYVRKGDPTRGGVKLLDLRDELRLSGGFAYALHRNIETITEVTGTVFVGGGTPNFNPVNPFDYQTGVRFHFFDGRLSFGGAYRVNLTRADEHTTPGFFAPTPATGQFFPINFTYASEGVSSYLGFLSFGTRRFEEAAPPAPNQAPVVTCTATPTSVTQTVGDPVVRITAEVRDPENDLVTYTWTATGGAVVQGSGPNVTVDTSNLAPGSYTVTVTVDDGQGNTATCSSTITVVEKPNACPTVSLTADPSSVEAGTNTRVTFHATASDPDGDQLTYEWSTSQGTLSGSGDTVTLDTTGMGAGTITVRVTVSDGKCPASASTSVTITERPAPPQASQLSTCEFRRRNDTRPDNACKAFLDDAAARLQQDPRATLVVRGFADQNERPDVAQRRAERVRDYLVSKGIDASRIRVEAVGATRQASQATATSNRFVEIWFVPEGAENPQ